MMEDDGHGLCAFSCLKFGNIYKKKLIILKMMACKNTDTYHPRRTLKEHGMNDVKSETSAVKSTHAPWKCVLLKALSYKNKTKQKQ